LHKFQYEGFLYEIGFKNLPENLQILNEITFKCFNKILEIAFSNAKKNDRVRIIIEHPSIPDQPISLPYMRFEDLNTQLIMTAIALVAQSQKELKLDHFMRVSTCRVNMPVGGTRNILQYISQKKGVVKISNTDNNCLFRAVIVAVSYLKFKTEQDVTKKQELMVKYKSVRRYTGVQNPKVNRLKQAINIDFDGPYGLDVAKKIEKYLKIGINVLGDVSSFYKYLTKGDVLYEEQIYLFSNNNHYDVINSLPSFFSAKNYCTKCESAFNTDLVDHPCYEICKICTKKDCKKTAFIKCDWCKTVCQNQNCLTHHEIKCQNQKRCIECGRNEKKNHICNGRYCINCKIFVDIEHKCYILTHEEKLANSKKSQQKEWKGYIFFDYECMIENRHIPNLIIAKKNCQKCIKIWKSGIRSSDCNSDCGNKRFGDNISFCEWLFEQTDYIAMAHNLSYDGFFVMQYIIENLLPDELKKINVLINGGKLLSIQFRNIKIIDSYNFIPLALSKCPKTFGLHELKKGYFPYLFNTIDNQEMKDIPYPDQQFYGVDYMSISNREDFLIWYETTKDKLFDLQKELEEYCISDVDILSKSVLTYRDIFLEVTKSALIENDTGIDPFQSCLTIASVCNLVFRRNFMKPKTIAIIPEYGLNMGMNHSHKQLLWLKYVSINNNINIQHCKNGGEHKIGKYYLDGYDANTNTGYEFHGCLFHGCPKCFKPSTFNTIKQETMRSIFSQHTNRINYLKLFLSNLEEIWECEWDSWVKSNNHLKDFIKNEKEIRPDLNPRDALFGGRTNASVLYYKVKNDEKIKYVDFTSVYPSVMKINSFPIGFPRVITENFEDLDKYFGLINCKLLPPKALLFPVLPSRVENKLLFVLCKKCGELKLKKCEHNDVERCIEGTWVTEEVKEAINQGYKMIKIFSIWHYDEKETYDPDLKQGGLFTGYINKFLKMKTEASGFPSHVTTEEEKRSYVTNYYFHEGVQLDLNNIKPNSGMKAISKLFLNSLWGRFGLNSNKTQQKLITEISDLYDLFLDDQYVVQDLNFLNENVCQAFYTKNDEMHSGSVDTNVVIAAFVTCYARLKLLNLLTKLGERVLYFDTDSVIYVSIPGEWDPEIGDYLGELTNELADGDFIVEGVFPGPKNYAFVTNEKETVCKVKGFSLNYKASMKVNFESMKEMILSEIENDNFEITVDQSVIKRNRKNWEICSAVVSKVYTHVYDKRILKEDFTTIPYGFC
jgi:hypothetical protein